jgi:hypothetical protein
MRHTAVTSSNIASVGYDEPSLTLEVTFKSGETYAYSRVPAAEHTALMAAESHGKYLNAYIKPRYAATRL